MEYIIHTDMRFASGLSDRDVTSSILTRGILLAIYNKRRKGDVCLRII